jgi:hypothetical protein
VLPRGRGADGGLAPACRPPHAAPSTRVTARGSCSRRQADVAAAEGALAALRAALASGDAAQCDAGALERLSEEATLALEVRPARDGAARCGGRAAGAVGVARTPPRSSPPARAR